MNSLPYPHPLQQIHLDRAVNLLLIGFLGTVIHHPIDKLFGERWFILTLPNVEITLATLVWCWGINIYFHNVWRAMYLLTGEEFCLWVSAIYLLAIPEFYVVWDKPWVWVYGLPLGTPALIAIGFGYYYWKKWKLQNS